MNKKTILWLLSLILAGLILASGCSTEDESGSGDYTYEDTGVDDSYTDSYPVTDSGYDDAYKYERQQRLRQIQDENNERIQQLQDEQWERETDRLVDAMDY